MATLNLVEYSELAKDAGGNIVMVGIEPAVTTQNVTFSTTTQSSTLNASTRFVYLSSDTNCRVVFGTNPTATTSTGVRLVANTGMFIGLKEGLRGSLKLAVVSE